MALVGIAALENRTATYNATIPCYLELVTSADKPINILEIGVFFSGIVSTSEPVDIEFSRNTTAGVTPSDTYVEGPNVLDGRVSETLETVSYDTWSGNEPTNDTKLWVAHIHPQGGMIWRPPATLSVTVSKSVALFMNPKTGEDVAFSAYIIFEE